MHLSKEINQATLELYRHLKSHMTQAQLVSWLFSVKDDAIYVSTLHENTPSILTPFKLHPRNDLLELIHNDDLENVLNGLKKALESSAREAQLELCFRLRRPNGEYDTILIVGMGMGSDPEGRPEYLSGNSYNLHVFKDGMEDAALFREKIRFALDAARDGLWNWDLSKNKIYYNSHYMDMLGYPRETFSWTQESWASYIHPDDLAPTLERHRLYIKSPTLDDCYEITYRFKNEDNTYRWLLARCKVVERDAKGRAVRIIGMHSDITDKGKDALVRLVQQDFLTKVGNRMYIEQRFSELCSESLPVSVLYIDVDGLKKVNDSLGHQAGDSLLRAAAELIRQAVRSTDVVARVGGDEFVVLMPKCPRKSAVRVREKIENMLDLRNANSDHIPIFLSIGIAGTDEGLQVEELLERADFSMLEIKGKLHDERHAVLQHWIDSHKERRENSCGNA